MDDIIFAHNGHYGGMCMSLQRVALLRRHAQANAPSYWFRLVLDEKVLGAFVVFSFSFLSPSLI